MFVSGNWQVLLAACVSVTVQEGGQILHLNHRFSTVLQLHTISGLNDAATVDAV